MALERNSKRIIARLKREGWVLEKAFGHWNETHQFYELGFREVFPISAEHGLNIGDLLDAVVEVLPEEDPSPDSSEPAMIATGVVPA